MLHVERVGRERGKKRERRRKERVGERGERGGLEFGGGGTVAVEVEVTVGRKRLVPMIKRRIRAKEEAKEEKGEKERTMTIVVRKYWYYGERD